MRAGKRAGLRVATPCPGLGGNEAPARKASDQGLDALVRHKTCCQRPTERVVVRALLARLPSRLFALQSESNRTVESGRVCARVRTDENPVEFHHDEAGGRARAIPGGRTTQPGFHESNGYRAQLRRASDQPKEATERTLMKGGSHVSCKHEALHPGCDDRFAPRSGAGAGRTGRRELLPDDDSLLGGRTSHRATEPGGRRGHELNRPVGLHTAIWLGLDALWRRLHVCTAEWGGRAL